MGTYCEIRCVNSDGTAYSIGRSSDGYPSFTGVRLHKFYNTQDKVNQLISLGGWFGQLGEKLREKSDDPDDAPYTYDSIDAPQFTKFIDDIASGAWTHKYIWMNGEWYYNGLTEKDKLINYIQEYLDEEQRQNKPIPKLIRKISKNDNVVKVKNYFRNWMRKLSMIMHVIRYY